MIYEDADPRKGAAPLASLFWWFVVLKSFLPFSLLIFAYVRHTPGMTALVVLGVAVLVLLSWRAGC